MRTDNETTSTNSPLMAERISKGPVVPIGGAEERSPNGVILRTFVDLAGKSDARIVVIPTASSEPDTGQDYVEIFRRIGATSAEIARIESREDANSDAMVEMLGSASGIFITGGDQARLSKLMVGTRAAEAIERCNAQGTVVAGTSAGASILSTHMLAIGVNSVTIVDGRDVYSDYHDRDDGDILTITGSSLHVMAPGRVFDLNRRE